MRHRSRAVHGLLFGGFAFVPGHEVVGVLEEVGPRAAAALGGRHRRPCRGRGVPVVPRLHCMPGRRVPALRTARPARHVRLRARRPASGTVGWLRRAPVPRARHDARASARRRSTRSCATLFNPVGAGIRWGVTLPGTRAGDVVAVLGPGIRGLATVAAVRDAGAGFVLVTGRGPRDAPRLDAARAFGADLDRRRRGRGSGRRAAGSHGRARRRRGRRHCEGTGRAGAGRRAWRAPAAPWCSPGCAAPGSSPTSGPTRSCSRSSVCSAHSASTSTPYRAALDLVASGRHPFADLAREEVGLDTVGALLATMAGESDLAPPVHGVVRP